MRLEYIDRRGAVLPLTGNPLFKLTNADGITSAAAEIATSTVPGMDGDFVNSVQAAPRTITLDLSIEQSVETAKRAILKVIKPKQSCTLRMEQEGRTLVIGGVVEEIAMPRFTSLAVMQVSIHCAQPFWEDEEETATDISETIPLFFFSDADEWQFFEEGEEKPFGEYDVNRTKVFENDGDAEVGLEIRIVALGEVRNPVVFNSKAEFIGVSLTLKAGDEVVITTGKGQKAITLNGQNVISSIMYRDGVPSTWLQLPTGEEEFTIDSDDGTEGNMYFTITYRRRFV